LKPASISNPAGFPQHTGYLTNDQAFAFLRIGVGAFFFMFAQYKVFGTEFTLHGGFQYWINLFLTNNAYYPFMKETLQNFVLPNATPIAFLVAYGEMAIAIALIGGIWVRVASAFGAVFMLTLLFASDYPGPDFPLWRYFGQSLSHSVFFLCFIAFILGNSAEAFSIRSSRWWRARQAANAA